MARQPRVDVAGEIYHIINRANARARIFKTSKDFFAVLCALEELLDKIPLEIFSFCIMPNHWHFSVRPQHDGDIGRFFGKFTQTVTQRWHIAHRTTGSGHLFQGRFKSFLVECDSYFLQLMKYIEANPLRAKMVARAEDWKWGSLYVRMNNSTQSKKLIAPWPLDIPEDYLSLVNQPLLDVDIESIRQSVLRGSPLGGVSWVETMVKQHHLEHTLRSPGRPRR